MKSNTLNSGTGQSTRNVFKRILDWRHPDQENAFNLGLATSQARQKDRAVYYLAKLSDDAKMDSRLRAQELWQIEQAYEFWFQKLLYNCYI